MASSPSNSSGLSGISFYTCSVFVLPLASAFNWQRGDVASAASILMVGTAIIAPIVGRPASVNLAATASAAAGARCEKRAVRADLSRVGRLFDVMIGLTQARFGRRHRA